jgi:hypothetical protein
MLPFRFFFLFSVGMLLFFFVGKFLLFAFLLAAGFSLIYNLFRKAGSMFYGRDWDRYSHPRYRNHNLKPVWKHELANDYPIRLDDFVNNERIIQVN